MEKLIWSNLTEPERHFLILFSYFHFASKMPTMVIMRRAYKLGPDLTKALIGQISKYLVAFDIVRLHLYINDEDELFSTEIFWSTFRLIILV